MIDLIERQQAIDVLKRNYPSNCFEELCKAVDIAIEALTEQTEIIHCVECVYYDPPHVENNGVRYEYSDMPKDAFDIFGIGVNISYGINVGGRCCRDYNVGYTDDKRVYVPENNYCGRAERRSDGTD